MKRTKLLIGLFLALVLVLSVTLMACAGGDKGSETGTTKSPESQSESPTEKPTESDTDAPTSGLRITVTPDKMEIYAGETIDLLFGVTVNEEGATLIVSDDGDFDPDTPGVYTITYQATKGDEKTTATRTVTVLAPLSALGLEVRTNYLGETKWQGKILSFAHALYKEINENTELSKESGVFRNTSDHDIVLSVDGGYGCAAVLDKNGVVIEGRDGANSKLINRDNPLRSSSTVTVIKVGDEEVSVSSAFAKQMTIPAGGYAIVVQANYAGTTADSDGRGFMNYNVIYSVGNVVRLYWVDSDETLTPYVNQKPTVSGNTKVLVPLGDTSFDLDTAILAGLTVKDDNGTFSPDDDVTLTEIEIVDRGGFDINTAGTYVIRLKVSDGELETEFEREVEVKSEGIGAVTVGDNKMNIALDRIAIDQDLSGVGNFAYIIYTPAYNGTIEYSNGYGAAFVVDAYGVIVRIYDGANGKYYDAQNKDGIKDETKCTPAGYIKEALASRQAGETVIIAPNSSSNNAEGGSRKFLLNNRTIGAAMTVPGVNFEAKSATITIDDKTFTAEEGKWLYNTEIEAKDAPKFGMLIYDKNFMGKVAINGYGAAIVLDKYGVLVKIYDGANMGFYTVDGKSTSPLTFTAANYATVAFDELADGETLIIFANDGGANESRAFALGLRGNAEKSYCGLAATLTGKTFEEKPADDKKLVIGDNQTDINPDRIAVNTTTATAADKDYYIFTTDFAGTLGFANDYGVAIVVKDGKIVRIYDGASGKYFDEDNSAGIQDNTKCTAQGYLNEALASLGANEWLLVATNNGGENLCRNFLYSNRTVGAEVKVTGVEFTPSDKVMKTVTVNGKIYFTAAISVNTEVTKPADTDFAVYSYGYNGVIVKNGWCEVFVFGADGKIVRIYDGVNGKFYDASNPAGIARTDDLFALATVTLDAFSALQPGETMLVAFNGGPGGNRARAFLVGNRVFDASVSLTGVTVQASAEKIAYMTVRVGGKVFYQDASKVAVNQEYTGTPAFAIYDYGFTGTAYTGGYGVALIVDKETGKVVKVYDGASAKYWDADQTGVAGVCTAAGYAAEAFAALQEGQYVLIAPNGGTAGNIARGLLYGNRAVGVDVDYTMPAGA